MNDYDRLLPLAGEIHTVDNAQWWQDLDTGESLHATRSRLGLLMLVVTEASEMVDARASGLRDAGCPEFSNEAIEAADIAIRLLDLIGADQAGAPDRRLQIVQSDLTEMHLIQALSLAAECHRKERVAGYQAALNSSLWIICELAEQRGIDLLAAVEAKRRYNAVRADHQVEQRRASGGKKQ